MSNSRGKLATALVRLGAMLGATIAMTALLGCQASPVEVQQQPHRNTRLNFSGMVPGENDRIGLEAYRHNDSEWREFDAVSTNGKYLDETNGMRWWMWEKTDAALPLSASYWRNQGAGNNRYDEIKVRSKSRAYGSLSVMRTAQCLLEELREGEHDSLIAVIDACSDRSEGVVRVACGGRSEACCAGSGSSVACDGNNRCKNDVCVAPPVIMVPSRPAVDPASPAPCADMAGAPCIVTPSQCANGYTQVMGKIRCSNGRPVCRATAGTDYCFIAGGACGGAVGNSCQYNEQCGPGSICDHEGICQKQCTLARNYCWHPSTNPMSPPADAKNDAGCIGPP